ncbi:MAG: hypothetical protein ACI9LX_003158 [Paraglaciecola sp.]|jgi:hypothetical protein
MGSAQDERYFIGDDVDKSSTETFLLFLYLFILVN